MDKITLSNIGTYHEIEYLKKTLGPVLISALAEVCLKRPTDPIEYLGHWLLRWRYNEELKRRDMENSIQVIRQRQAKKCDDERMVECNLPLDPYGQGVLPLFPFLPPGYGGPISQEELDSLQPKEEEEEEEDPSQVEELQPIEIGGEGYYQGVEIPGEGYDQFMQDPGYGYNYENEYQGFPNENEMDGAPVDWSNEQETGDQNEYQNFTPKSGTELGNPGAPAGELREN